MNNRDEITEKKVYKNAAWIIVMRVLQALINFSVNVLTARFLGPSNYGEIAYAASLVSFLLPIAQLGFTNILVQFYINKPGKEGVIFGTALTMSLISSFLCIVSIISFVLITDFNDAITIIVCSLYSIVLLFNSLDLMRYWYQAKLMSKYSSIISLVAFFIVSIYRIVILILNTNIYYFAITQAADYLIISALLLLFYKKKGGMKFSFSKEMAKELLSASKYYIFLGLMVAIYSQTDKILLNMLVNEKSVGIYNAGITISGATGIIFVAFIDSMRPLIYKYKKDNNNDLYGKSIENLYSVIFYLGLIQGIVLTIISFPLIGLLYGEEYTDSAWVLMVMAWQPIFSYFGSVRGIWVLSESKQKYLPPIYIFSAVFNTVFNFILIPICGALGASMATLITEFLANFIACIILKPIRPCAKYMINGMNPKKFYLVLKNNLKLRKSKP